MYITKNQQHEETQHADKVNTMNVHNKTISNKRKHNMHTWEF